MQNGSKSQENEYRMELLTDGKYDKMNQVCEFGGRKNAEENL